MNHPHTSQSLSQLLDLTERKESLLEEVKKIEAQLAALLPGGKTPKVSKGRPGRPAKAKKSPAPKAGRRKRGSLGKKVLAALESAGPAGVKVVELAKKIGVKGTNLHVWFATTGKKHAKKVGRGHYRVKKG
mgnify:CR=1 FL=1